MQSFRKTNEQSPRYLKTDRQTDGQADGQGRLLWTLSGKHGVQNRYKKNYFVPVIDFEANFFKRAGFKSLFHP